ncbi:hypothetical protein EDC04DRAFT_2613772 [Pisolithus marmoratus]|nr:hypothetical protein EDC04DRAFT_2613772 [Pisolithus marmoratus]
MAASNPRKQLTQSNHPFPQEADLDAHKKLQKANSADTNALLKDDSLLNHFIYVTGTKSMHHSSRLTKGSGSQITQLCNIEHIQIKQTTTSKASHASYLEVTTANEPLNPLAPVKLKPKPKLHMKTSSACASSGGLDKEHGQDDVTTAPMSHAGSITPMSCRGSVAPTSSQGSEEEDSQLPDHHYSFLHPPTSGGIDLNIDKVSSEHQSQKPQTSYKDGTPSPLIDPVLLAEDACFKINIVEEHHHQNHFPHALDPQHLCDVHQQQLPGVSALLQQDVPLHECSPVPADIKDLVPMVSSGELGGPATKLHSSLTNSTKSLNKLNGLPSVVPPQTPSPAEHAMAEHEQVGMLIPPGYGPDYHKALGILGGFLKIMLCTLMCFAAPGGTHDMHYLLGSNQPAEENLSNAQELIQGAKFMRDGAEDGTTMNMASPALAGLIIDFFYATLSVLSHLFPEVFVQEVPKSVVCLVVTALMAMQAKIDGNCKHAAMTWALRMSWATSGSALLGGKMATTSKDDFEVVLD